jgi:arylsulfatase A-like enzyme
VPRPNVLLVHTDQQRFDALGTVTDEIHTPNLDRLAAEGVRFERYFVNNPVCMPSRESYMTGQYPSQLGILYQGIPLPEDVPTLPDMLANYGYTSANLGKLHFLPHGNRYHDDIHPDYGFDQIEISDEPGPYPDAYRAWVKGKAPDQLDTISVGLPPLARKFQDITQTEDDIEHPELRFPKRPVPFEADADLTHTAFVAERTLDFLDRHRHDQPFLCVSGFYSPHSPWVVPQEYLDLYDPDDLTIPSYPAEAERRREEIADEPDDSPDWMEKPRYTDAELRRARHGYYAMVSEVDHHVGRILDRLDELGLRDNTVVMFTSDHGEYLGEHLRYGKGWPGHDASSRVPFVVRWPEGVHDPGRTVEGIVEAVDLVPTILDCVDVQAPPHLIGESVRPALAGREFGGRESALLETYQGTAVRTDRYRYAVDDEGEESLFDLDADFGAYRDVADDPDYGEALGEVRHHLLDRLISLNIDSERKREWRS